MSADIEELVAVAPLTPEMLVDAGHQFRPTPADIEAAKVALYFSAARRAGVTRRVAAKALDAAMAAAPADPLAAAWAALGARSRGRA